MWFSYLPLWTYNLGPFLLETSITSGESEDLEKKETEFIKERMYRIIFKNINRGIIVLE